MTSPTDPGVQILAVYAHAVATMDVEALMALYDADVHVFDMWGAWSLRGIIAWQVMAQEWFRGLRTDQVLVSSDAV